MLALDKRDGKQLWRAYTVAEPGHGAGIWSSVSVDLQLGLVYASTSNDDTGPTREPASAFHAFELATGSSRFSLHLEQDRASLPVAFGANPVLYDVPVRGETKPLMAGGAKSGQVYALDRRTGEMVWTNKHGPGSLDGDLGIFVNTAWTGTYVLVALNRNEGSEDSATLAALDGATGALMWERVPERKADVLGRITVANGVGFVGLADQLDVFDVDNGKLIKTVYTNGPTALGTASIADGIVAFGTGVDSAVGSKLIVLEIER